MSNCNFIDEMLAEIDKNTLQTTDSSKTGSYENFHNKPEYSQNSSTDKGREISPPITNYNALDFLDPLQYHELENQEQFAIEYTEQPPGTSNLNEKASSNATYTNQNLIVMPISPFLYYEETSRLKISNNGDFHAKIST